MKLFESLAPGKAAGGTLLPRALPFEHQLHTGATGHESVFFGGGVLPADGRLEFVDGAGVFAIVAGKKGAGFLGLPGVGVDPDDVPAILFVFADPGEDVVAAGFFPHGDVIGCQGPAVIELSAALTAVKAGKPMELCGKANTDFAIMVLYLSNP